MSSATRVTSRTPQESKKSFTARLKLGSILTPQSSVFYLILGITLFLMLIGFAMVLSASSVDSYLKDEGFFGRFLKQVLFAAMGLPLMLIASRLPLVFWKRWALIFLLGSLALQFLVFTALGVSGGGNTNWIRIGGFNAQPSEFLKITLALWLGVALPRSIARHAGTYKVLAPLLVAAAAMGLVLLGGDLGTASILFLIVLGCLIYAGISWKYIMAPIVLAIVGFIGVAVLSPTRVARILTFFTSSCTDDTNWCWQPLHGNWAMASGGLFGVGLGKSKAKWSWLPASDNDYIFAIIGEELGMIGCLVVLSLFVVLAFALFKVIREAQDPFVRIATGGIMMWIIGQAFLNIAVVLGLVPVLGVPLPFISSGGTSLFTALIGIGIVLSFVRANDKAKTLT